jgi:hypothetical protein
MPKRKNTVGYYSPKIVAGVEGFYQKIDVNELLEKTPKLL